MFEKGQVGTRAAIQNAQRRPTPSRLEAIIKLPSSIALRKRSMLRCPDCIYSMSAGMTGIEGRVFSPQSPSYQH
jgi:hypothetical protein